MRMWRQTEAESEQANKRARKSEISETSGNYNDEAFCLHNNEPADFCTTSFQHSSILFQFNANVVSFFSCFCSSFQIFSMATFSFQMEIQFDVFISLFSKTKKKQKEEERMNTCLSFANIASIFCIELSALEKRFSSSSHKYLSNIYHWFGSFLLEIRLSLRFD